MGHSGSVAGGSGSRVAKKASQKALKLERVRELLAAKREAPKRRDPPQGAATAKPPPGLSALQGRMQQKLKGARFRWINESMYTATGDETFRMVQADPSIFAEYHEGFAAQVRKWPANPLDGLIEDLRGRRRRLVVADMGCGEARLAAAVGAQHTVHSFDLVAHNDRITACNIASVPLAGGTVDVAIFCLALMGTDFIAFVREANRILRAGGEMRIAEVASRIADMDAFVAALEAQGFRLARKDTRNKMFVMLDLTKTGPCGAGGGVAAGLLKPPQLYRHQRAVIFPGQGSQFVGMGRDLYEQFPAARRVFEEADEALGLGLSRLVLGGDPGDLVRTENAQPAIVAASVAALRALESATGLAAGDMYSFAMGHSVGEYSALIAAQAISLADGIRLVRARGRAMQAAARGHDHAMSACILRRAAVADVVADVERVQRELDAAGGGGVVQVANINSSSQVVLSGTRAAVDRALASLQQRRLAMRAVNLPVSAPFHCRLMRPARAALEAALAAPVIRPRAAWAMPVVSNVTARPHASADDARRLLVDQIDRPVLWLQSMRHLKDIHGISRWGAMGPGSVVGNLASKEFAKDIVRRLTDAAAIRDFAAVLERQAQRGY
ncbi:hypothetical protein H4R18_002592 [Coemansia javaensis]|uniref:Ribosomal RNA-processing protein 8 n=1 Tax=Coemansia javaensis TaxID=2761396 RepID=A0A9W8LIX3_9FUNG|nr:hypothetical protein H4R18_002592 [Coemansia javaensis]